MTTTVLDAHLLACPPRIRQALIEAGFNNVHDVVHLSAMDLAKEIQSSPEEAQYVIDLAKSKALGTSLGGAITFRTALDMFENPNDKIPLGLARLDKALGGGITMGQVTEICGPPGAGKTQISMLRATMAIKSHPSCSVLYIDTEGSFVPERVEEIASKVAAEVSANQILSQIQYVRIHSNVEQLALISNLAEHLDAHRNIRLVILDSIAFHMRQDMQQDFNKKQQALANMFHVLTKLAFERKCAICVTNHITVRKVDDGNAKLVPALGDLWAHVPAERFFVYNSDDFRGLLVHKSPSSPQVLIDLNRELPLLFTA
jgi:RAD51-like protein 2